MIFFYPHTYLRDRHLDTIRNWPVEEVVNREMFERRHGAQVPADQAKKGRIPLSWKQKLPLLNLKRRPPTAPKDAVVYVWGGLMISGDFIVELDNPWGLVGYNLRAMAIYKPLIRRILLAKRCREIRCMSNACRKSLRLLFGEEVYSKAEVHYPYMQQVVDSVKQVSQEARFVFVGTQFEIKGGKALLQAFGRVYSKFPNCRLDVVTHLPGEFLPLAKACPGIRVHEARFSREEIHHRFMKHADVLVLPTYVESFGMVALEALAYGMALIVTKVYALSEMVEPGINGELLQPPISIWDGYRPSSYQFHLANIKKYIRNADTRSFENHLALAIEKFVIDPEWRLRARQGSIRLFRERFAC